MTREIMHSIVDGDIEKFDRLVPHAIDEKFVTDNEKWNLLHLALVSVSMIPIPKMIKHLIEFGVDVNARDHYGNTPLHYAARLKNSEIMEMLLNAHAEVDPINKDGLTPLHLMLTKKPHNLQAIELLLSHGANIQKSFQGELSVWQYVKTIAHEEDAEMLNLFTKYVNIHRK